MAPSPPRPAAYDPRRGAWLRIVGLALAILLLALVGGAAFRAVAAWRLRAAAAERGLSASWRDLRLGFPLRVAVADLAFARAGGDTVFRAGSLEVGIHPWWLLVLRPRLTSVSLERVTLAIGRPAAGADTLPPPETRRRQRGSPERYQRLRRTAENAVRLLLAPARRMPRLTLEGVRIQAGGGLDEAGFGARIDWLELSPARGAVHLAAQGSLLLESAVPFDLGFDYGRDDRLGGGARFLLPAAGGGPREALRVAIQGKLSQDRRRGVLSLGDSTRVMVGHIPFLISGSLERRGPRVRFALAANHLDQRRLAQGLPQALLGPLAGVAMHGWFDYRLDFDLDLAHPDSVTFAANVIPHGLALDSERTRLRLSGLDEPFVARIHLPHGRIETRELSAANPRFRPLAGIDTLLVGAVVTNEDGGFFQHRGFNIEAVTSAIAENLRAGAFRRGAGTITMQLARNLYLGHERTLSRKAQEVVLAWMLEHLTWLSKQRLLEIYLNIIEWGPGVHGADEATQYYFGHDAGHVTVDEALFLSTVLPAPTKWRYRFNPDGSLRPFERAQMHFIGRAMIKKGWLRPELLPAADALHVALRGPARDVLLPPIVPGSAPEPPGAPPAPPTEVPVPGGAAGS